MKNRVGQFMVFLLCLAFIFGGVIAICQACPMKSHQPMTCCSNPDITQPSLSMSCCSDQANQSISIPKAQSPKSFSSDIFPALREIGFSIPEKPLIVFASDVFLFHSPPHRLLHAVFII